MATLKALLKPKKQVIVDFPEYDEEGKSIGKIGIRLMNQADHEEITLKANEETYKKMQTEANGIDQKSNTYAQLFDLLYNQIASRHALYKMCFDPDTNVMPFFENAEEPKRLNPAQIEFINIEYTKLKQGNPHFTTLSVAEFEKTVSDIQKDMESGSNFLERRLLPNVRTNFILFLISELWKSREMVNGLQVMQQSLLSAPSEDSNLLKK